MSSVETQGMRVHRLANLGGLVVIAELDGLDSTLLLGCLLQLKNQIEQLTEQQLISLKELGLQKLRERKTEKRVLNNKPQTNNTNIEYHLKEADIKKLIIKLHGRVPVLAKDLIPELLRLMR